MRTGREVKGTFATTRYIDIGGVEMIVTIRINEFVLVRRGSNNTMKRYE